MTSDNNEESPKEYYVATGIITLKEYTPVAKSLLKGFDIDINTATVAPNVDMVTIPFAYIETGKVPTFKTFSEGINEILVAKGCPDKTMTPETHYDIVVLMNNLLDIFAASTDSSPDLRGFVDGQEFLMRMEDHQGECPPFSLDTRVPVNVIFEFLKLCNDGHNFFNALLQGAHWGSEVELGNFSGSYLFVGRHHNSFEDTQSFQQLSIVYEYLLDKGSYDKIAEQYLYELRAKLGHIRNDDARKAIVEKFKELIAMEPTSGAVEQPVQDKEDLPKSEIVGSDEE